MDLGVELESPHIRDVNRVGAFLIFKTYDQITIMNDSDARKIRTNPKTE